MNVGSVMHFIMIIHLLIPVNGMPIGHEMYRSKKYGGLVTSPITFNIKDNLAKKLVKTLVSTMIAFNPSDRPTIDVVLQELQMIAGNVCWDRKSMF